MSDLIPAYMQWLRRAGRSANTIRDRQRLLIHADRHLPWGLEDADESEIIEYGDEADWSQWTRHTYDSHLRGFYHWGVLTENLSLDPMLHIPRPKAGDQVPNPCTDAELARALTARWQPWGMAAMLAAYAGLRCCEIVTVRREHIDHGRLRVKGKGGKSRIVPLAEPLWKVVESMPPGLLCVGAARGQALTAKTLTQLQRATWRKAGLPDGFRMHRMRHWFATRVLEGGTDIRVLQKLLGHASLTSTQGYTDVIEPRMDAAVATLPVVTSEPDGSRLGRPTTEAA